MPAGFRPNPLAGDMHRAAAAGMARRPDRAAEKVRRRHEHKATRRLVRAVTREIGFLGAVTLTLRGAQFQPDPPASEECEDCLRRARRTAARRAQFGPSPMPTVATR